MTSPVARGLLIAVSAILIVLGALGMLLRHLRRSLTSPEAFFAQLGEPDRCRASDHAEVCWANGATEADARALLGAIAAAPPTREVRLRVLRNGSGGEVVLIASGPADAGAAELARLGRRLYDSRPPDSLDVFLTGPDWKGWRLVHGEPPPGSANQACCAFAIPSDAPAVKSLPGDPPSQAGQLLVARRRRPSTR